MNSCNNNTSWFFSILAFVALVTAGSFFLDNKYSAKAELIQFSDLSDADVNVILAVKARMQDAKHQSNQLAFN